MARNTANFGGYLQDTLQKDSKGDFGTVLDKRKNCMRRRQYQYFACSHCAKNTHGNNPADCSPAGNSVDFGQTSAP